MIPCSSCGVEKPESDYYAKHRKCKACLKSYNREYYLAHRESIRTTLLERMSDPEKRASRNAKERDRYHQAIKNDPERYAESLAKKRLRNRVRYQAIKADPERLAAYRKYKRENMRTRKPHKLKQDLQRGS